MIGYFCGFGGSCFLGFLIIKKSIVRVKINVKENIISVKLDGLMIFMFMVIICFVLDFCWEWKVVLFLS